MSDFKITGNPNPVVGKEEFYTINAFFGSLLPNPLMPKSSFGPPVSWTIHVLENGKWRKTKENDKTGDKVSYTFLQKSLERKGIRILAKRGEQVARLDIKTQAAGIPKIDSVELLDKSGKKPAKPLSYGQTLKARVHCLHMEKRKVYVTLWEDDAKKGGHNTANEKNIIETRFGIVKNGKADVDFPLRPSFAKIATKAGPESDKIHEYYVTTEFNKEKIPSNNVNVNELEAPVAPFKGKTTTPAQTQPVRNNVPVQLPKPKTTPTQTKPKGVINSVNITDANGNKIKGVFKENRIKVWINSKGLIGKEVRLKLYDEDILSDDELLDQKFTIKSDLHVRLVPLDTIPRSLGGDFGEGPELELFAYVEVLQSDVNKPSEVVKVDATVFKPDPIQPTNNVMKQGKTDKKDEKKDKKTCECESYNLYYGKKVSCEFRKKVMKISKELWPKNYKEMANGLMAVMHRETSGTLASNQLEGYKSLISKDKMTMDLFEKKNPTTGKRSSRAVGLIQFTQNSLVQMKEFENGDGFDALHKLKLSYAKMKEVDQLDKVKKYMKAVKSLPSVPEDIYVAVFAPFYVGESKDTVMYKKGTNDYVSNPGLDLDNNGIQIKELLGAFKKSLHGGPAYSKYKCENSEEGNTGNKENTDGKWHHPVNNPQLRGWYSIWAPERSIHSSHIVGRSKGKHDGIDLYAPTGTILYACIDGEVNEIYYSESYGNCINIKGEYNGKTYWFFYAHLSETFITAKDENGNPTKVKAGKEIGKSGKTGSSATALKPNQVHLHFEIRTKSARTGGRVDPFDNISELDKDVIKEPKKENQP